MRYVFSIMLLAIALEQGVCAAPRVPTDPHEVLEQLPAQVFTPVVGKTAVVDVADSLKQAQTLLDYAQQNGDPRYLGYAEAQLQLWLRQKNIPDDVLLMRARLRQFNHQFSGALIDIAQVLQHQPSSAEALLLQAAIYQVRADYSPARATCQRLRNLSTLMLALICEAQVDAVTGKSAQAQATLTRFLPIVHSLEPSQQAWFYLALGDLSVRQGQLTQAESYYRRMDMNSVTTLAAVADVLLQQQRYQDVKTLLNAYQMHDGLLLRLARAEYALKKSNAKPLIETLRQRFSALRLRGERSHLREEAMFNFYLLNNSAQALVLARANWQQQREPQDAQIYWLSAQATQSAQDITLIRQWRQQTGLEDVQLATAKPSGVLR